MFYWCYSLTRINLKNLEFDVKWNFYYMFSIFSSLETIDISKFITSSANDFSYMFDGCTSLTEIELGRIDTSSVTTMKNMFSSCTQLRHLDLYYFKTSNCRNFANMFENTVNLTVRVNKANAQNLIDALPEDVEIQYDLF